MGDTENLSVPALIPGHCTVVVLRLLRPVSEMAYTVSSGTLNSTIPYHTDYLGHLKNYD